MVLTFIDSAQALDKFFQLELFSTVFSSFPPPGHDATWARTEATLHGSVDLPLESGLPPPPARALEFVGV